MAEELGGKIISEIDGHSTIPLSQVWSLSCATCAH